jgi:hypothetical protein
MGPDAIKTKQKRIKKKKKKKKNLLKFIIFNKIYYGGRK